MTYIYIRAWGNLTGSMEYYIQDQIAHAKKDKAPANAIYKDALDEWQTFDSIVNLNTKERVAIEVARLKGPHSP